MEQYNGLEIAIIGMAGRFPGGRTVAEFWRNIYDGVELITTFSKQELLEAGVNPLELNNPNYVKARGMLADIEYFDAAFFGYSPREAEMMDPQHRIFLEVAYEAIEHAGYNPDTYNGLIGVYAGTSMNSYLLSNLMSRPDLITSIGGLQFVIGNDKDHLATRTSYKLNLKGPSLNINTACSTSLVTVHLACRSLLSGECDIALAGGVSISVPQKAGYLYQEGGITSPDGHCRAFDANAQGTVPGSGVGVAVLKRLEDALADGDTIHALIKGSAINNDGAMKVGYTAPSMDGQARVIQAAHLTAEVAPETITYIEAHGTATPLGDPIEIAALTQAFRATTNKTGFCAIGSVKTNVGHLDAAAGIAGLLKMVEALKHGVLPPSLHFTQANSKIDFANSPFYVNTCAQEWKRGETPRRAGVSSFGIGGTNAHVIVQEAPFIEPSSALTRSNHLILLSAATPSTLTAMTTRLAAHIEQHPDLNLADLAYTSQVGRKALRYRRMLVCRDHQDTIHTLQMLPANRVFTSEHETSKPSLTFMFPGQGTQYIHMATAIYREEPTFREIVTHCSTLLKPYLGLDLRQIIYPADKQQASKQLEQTRIAQPALFVVEYALAHLWMQWGVTPRAMIGHSIGEYVAACLAGVFSLEDALALVASRGNMMQQLPEGAMLHVSLPETTVNTLLGTNLALAAVNGASQCVVAGPIDAIEELREKLTSQGVACRRLHTSHAFHSAMMEPMLTPFARYLAGIRLHAPDIPYISNVTGNWITDNEATDPAYWCRHLRQTVRFVDGVQTLCREPANILLEVGPGRTLSTLARPYLQSEQLTLSSLPQPQEPVADNAYLLTTLGKLWLAGVTVNWAQLYAHERRQRIPLPTYPFAGQRYWIEATSRQTVEDRTEQIETASPLHLRPNLSCEYVTPSNEIEQTIAHIWQELLGIEQIGIYDNFFELGGHSLLSTQLISRLYDTFQIQVQLQSLFAQPTIAELASTVLALIMEQVDEALLAELEQLSPDEVQRTLDSE